MNLNKFIVLRYKTKISVSELDEFARTTVYFNVANPPQILNGKSQLAQAGSEIKMPVTMMPDGAAIVFYADPADNRISRPFAGILLKEAFQIVWSMSAIDSIVLQSNKECALIINKRL